MPQNPLVYADRMNDEQNKGFYKILLRSQAQEVCQPMSRD